MRDDNHDGNHNHIDDDCDNDGDDDVFQVVHISQDSFYRELKGADRC